MIRLLEAKIWLPSDQFSVEVGTRSRWGEDPLGNIYECLTLNVSRFSMFHSEFVVCGQEDKGEDFNLGGYRFYIYWQPVHR